MRGWGIGLLGLLACGGARAADDPVPLKPGQGQELTTAYCNVCHTSDYIAMNSVFLGADAWKAEVLKMRNAFGAPMDDATAAEIILYLSANYAVAAKQ